MEVRFFKYDDTTMTLLPCARVDDFTSLVFTRSYSGVGKWQMTIPLTSKNAGLLMEADILHLRHGVSGLITKYTKSVEDGNEMLTVNGIELKGLVCGRIVLPPEGQAYSTYRNTDPAAVIGYLILDQLLTADESRRVPGTILWPATGSRITYSGRFSSLEEDTTRSTGCRSRPSGFRTRRLYEIQRLKCVQACVPSRSRPAQPLRSFRRTLSGRALRWSTYKQIIYSDPPSVIPEGYVPSKRWEEGERTITQIWTLVPAFGQAE